MSRRGRILKFLALAVVGGIALATFVANYQREAIATQIINRLLRDQGIAATSLSIDSLGTDELSLSRLVLEHTDGTEYDLRGLSMPISFPSIRPELIRIDSLSITPGDGERQPVLPADLLRSILSLPSVAPNTAVAVGRFTWPGLPPIESLVWRAAEAEQRLDFVTLGLTTSVSVTKSADTVHTVAANAHGISGDGLFILAIDATEHDRAYDVEGSLSLDLEPLLNIAAVREYVGNVESGSGRFEGRLQAQLDDDADARASAVVLLRISDGAGIRYAPPNSSRGDVSVLGEQEIELDLRYPAPGWSLSADAVAGRISIDDAGSINVESTALECVDGSLCVFGVGLDSSQLQMGSVVVRDLHADGHAEVDLGDAEAVRLTGLQVTTGIATGDTWSVGTTTFRSDAAVDLELRPEGVRTELPSVAISIAGLRTGDISVGTLQAGGGLSFAPGDPGRVEFTGVTGSVSGIDAATWSIGALAVTDPANASFEMDDSDWRGSLERVALRADVIRVGESLSVSLPVTLTGLRLADAGASSSARFSIAPRAATIRWNDLELVAPAIDGRFQAGATYSAELDISNPARSTAATIVVRHDPADGHGSFKLADGLLDLEITPMSRRVLRWDNAWDLVGGRISAEATLGWRDLDGETVLDGRAQITSEGVAGNYGDIAFAGLAGSMGLLIDPAEGLRGEEATMSLALLDVGVPVEDLDADVQWDTTGDALAVSNLTMKLFGGRVTAEPFRFHMTPGDADVRFEVESVQLPLILALAEFESVDMTGSLSGTLPVRVAGGTVTVSDGLLSSDSPGGVIRYRGASVSPGDTSPLGLVNTALSNFQYESLTAGVNYTESGDLKVQMRLTGVNPDMDERQPVILNLGVENNIPQLLRSLQATRAIEDVLERRGNQ